MNQNRITRIALLGDIFPAELPYTKNFGIKTQFRQHKGVPWVNKIKNILGDNDIVIGNLESPLVEDSNTIKKTFYGDPQFVLFLKECGIDILNVANNHILEQGEDGFKNTVCELEKAGLVSIGHVEESKSKIYYSNINGLKIAIAGFSNVDLHVIKNEGSFAVLNEENVLGVLRIMKERQVDVKIICFHWGNEYIHIPSIEQRKLAYTLIDNGADIIVGHHPHVIQPYEKYKNGHIFYSLGNFMFDYIHSKIVSIGLVAKLEITEKKQIHVNLIGVKLSYKNTVALLPKDKFEKYYLRITKLYDKYRSFSDQAYAVSYNTLRKRNRFMRRVAMKTSILKELLLISNKDKRFLLKNIIEYYSKIIKRIIS